MPPERDAQSAPPPGTRTGTAPGTRPDSWPSSGYLHGVLADGARPFLYRSRLRRLLGLPETDQVSLAFASHGLMPGFTYVRAQAGYGNTGEGYADGLPAGDFSLVETEDLAPLQTPSAGRAVGPGLGASPSVAPGREVSEPGTARTASLGSPAVPLGPPRTTGADGTASDRSGRADPATTDLPAAPFEPPSAPQVTSLAIPGASRATSTPAMPPAGAVPGRSAAPTDAVPPARPDRTAESQGAMAPAIPLITAPAMAQVHGAPQASQPGAATSGRWHPAQVAAAMPAAAMPAGAAPAADHPRPPLAAPTTNPHPAPAVTLPAAPRSRSTVAEEATIDTAGPLPDRPAQPGATPDSGFELALPYLGRGARGQERTRGKRPLGAAAEQPEVDDDEDRWPTTSRPAQPPATQVVVVNAPEGYGRQPTAAFWERSHRRRLQTRLLR